MLYSDWLLNTFMKGTLSNMFMHHSTICFHNMIFILVFPNTKEFCSLIESLRTINIHENKKNSK